MRRAYSRLRRAVGAARQSLEPKPIPNLDKSSACLYEPALFQHLHRFRHPSPSHTQHDGDELMRKSQGVTIGAVMSHKNPSCEALLQIGIAVHQQRLRRLDMKCLNIQEQSLVNAGLWLIACRSASTLMR